jgi:hypothetical protein
MRIAKIRRQQTLVLKQFDLPRDQREFICRGQLIHQAESPIP